MQLVRYKIGSGAPQAGLIEQDTIRPLVLDGNQYRSLSDILEDVDAAGTVQLLCDRSLAPVHLATVTLLPPLDRQEVWAAGVTYKRSQVARMEESEAAASCYDRVYVADRPELFFKAQPWRVAASGQPIRIRQDSTWNVPEPELGLVLNSSLKLVGFTIGNDVSSRDIEGENPLYLPQAKVYDQSCALGPGITLAGAVADPTSLEIRLTILRGGAVAFAGTTSVANMARSFEHLIGYLGRDMTFPYGAVLLTGTGIVPDSSFTLTSGDVVQIAIEGLGTLTNPVA